MTSMRDDLAKAIADAVTVEIASCDDGTSLVKSLDSDTANVIASAVVKWLRNLPIEGFAAENHERGEYSRRNIEALCDDIEDDA